MEKKTKRNKVLSNLRIEFNLAMLQLEAIFTNVKKKNNGTNTRID